MSQGKPVPWAVAHAIAQALVVRLEPGCERIEIAGSLRREKPHVRDIEIVAVPRFAERAGDDLWATEATHDLLEERIAELISYGVVTPRPVENHRADGTIDTQHKLGPAFKALQSEGLPVDLFIVRPPATWGCIFALRTGPGDWNTKLVMDCKAIGRRVAGGQVERWASDHWAAVPTPEERDFFAALGQPWVEPRDRTPARIRISRVVADEVLA